MNDYNVDIITDFLKQMYENSDFSAILLSENLETLWCSDSNLNKVLINNSINAFLENPIDIKNNNSSEYTLNTLNIQYFRHFDIIYKIKPINFNNQKFWLINLREPLSLFHNSFSPLFSNIINLLCSEIRQHIFKIINTQTIIMDNKKNNQILNITEKANNVIKQCYNILNLIQDTNSLSKINWESECNDTINLTKFFHEIQHITELITDNKDNIKFLIEDNLYIKFNKDILIIYYVNLISDSLKSKIPNSDLILNAYRENDKVVVSIYGCEIHELYEKYRLSLLQLFDISNPFKNNEYSYYFIMTQIANKFNIEIDKVKNKNNTITYLSYFSFADDFDNLNSNVSLLDNYKFSPLGIRLASQYDYNFFK